MLPRSRSIGAIRFQSPLKLSNRSKSKYIFTSQETENSIREENSPSYTNQSRSPIPSTRNFSTSRIEQDLDSDRKTRLPKLTLPPRKVEGSSSPVPTVSFKRSTAHSRTSIIKSSKNLLNEILNPAPHSKTDEPSVLKMIEERRKVLQMQPKTEASTILSSHRYSTGSLGHSLMEVKREDDTSTIAEQHIQNTGRKLKLLEKREK